MSRVITFSRVFPSYHPRKGEPTHFVEKVWESLIQTEQISTSKCCELSRQTGIGSYTIRKINFDPKHHTIRAGHRWKAGDFFSPRTWSGIPYKSKQITFAPDIEIKQIWDFDINGTDWALDGRLQYALTGEGFDLESVAKNDGLSLIDFDDWFTMSPDYKRKQEFHGQIICWNENINY